MHRSESRWWWWWWWCRRCSNISKDQAMPFMLPDGGLTSAVDVDRYLASLARRSPILFIVRRGGQALSMNNLKNKFYYPKRYLLTSTCKISLFLPITLFPESRLCNSCSCLGLNILDFGLWFIEFCFGKESTKDLGLELSEIFECKVG